MAKRHGSFRMPPVNEKVADVGGRENPYCRLRGDQSSPESLTSERYGSTRNVRVYSLDRSLNRWTQLGQDLNGEDLDSVFGRSVAISADGMLGIATLYLGGRTIVAAGAEGNDGNGVDSGYMRDNWSTRMRCLA